MALSKQVLTLALTVQIFATAAVAARAKDSLLHDQVTQYYQSICNNGGESGSLVAECLNAGKSFVDQYKQIPCENGELRRYYLGLVLNICTSINPNDRSIGANRHGWAGFRVTCFDVASSKAAEIVAKSKNPSPLADLVQPELFDLENGGWGNTGHDCAIPLPREKYDLGPDLLDLTRAATCAERFYERKRRDLEDQILEALNGQGDTRILQCGDPIKPLERPRVFDGTAKRNNLGATNPQRITMPTPCRADTAQ